MLVKRRNVKRKRKLYSNFPCSIALRKWSLWISFLEKLSNRHFRVRNASDETHNQSGVQAGSRSHEGIYETAYSSIVLRVIRTKSRVAFPARATHSKLRNPQLSVLWVNTRCRVGRGCLSGRHV